MTPAAPGEALLRALCPRRPVAERVAAGRDGDGAPQLDRSQVAQRPLRTRHAALVDRRAALAAARLGVDGRARGDRKRGLHARPAGERERPGDGSPVVGVPVIVAPPSALRDSTRFGAVAATVTEPRLAAPPATLAGSSLTRSLTPAAESARMLPASVADALRAVAAS